MTWNPQLPEMPVGDNGDVLHYPERYLMKNGGRWETWHNPWYGELRIDGMTNGRSAKYLNLVDANGRKYPMFISDLVAGINNGTLTIEAGVLSGYWTGSKRGSNYGIKTV